MIIKEYSIRVEYNNLKWEISKRFSDFVKLHEELVHDPTIPKDVAKKFPKLPQKKLIGVCVCVCVCFTCGTSRKGKKIFLFL